jgi:hypothetical protein
LINAIASQQVSASISDIGKEITKMQSGGVVPKLRDFSRQDQVGSDINKVLNGLIRQKVDEAIKEVQKQMMPGKFDEGGRPTPPGGAPGSPGSTPSAPGDYDSGKTGSYASGAYIGQPGDTDGEQTGLDMNLSGGIGTPIYAPRDLIYRSKGTDGNSSVGLQGTADALGPSGSGFGYYGSYYFKDGDKEYEVLMGHFRDLPYKGSKEGQIIPKGTLLGYQGASGRTIGAGGKPYPHISLHLNGIGFNASNQKLVEFAESLVKSGGTTAQEPPNKNLGRSQASWYGPGFYGNQTADDTGKYILKRDSLWVAHKTLPFGTKVKFTYNGKTITLPVRDRGPFKDGREWDLTEAAADQLGMKSAGEVNLQYEILGKQGGGYVPKQSPNKKVSSLRSYPSYSDGGMMIAIQPMIIEKPVPMPMGGNRTIMFPVPVGVNNSNVQSLSRG